MHITTHIATHMTRVLLLILLVIFILQVWENDDYALNEANDAIALRELKQVLFFFNTNLALSSCTCDKDKAHVCAYIYIKHTKIHILYITSGDDM